MSAVRITASAVRGIAAQTLPGAACIVIQADMTDAQKLAAVLELLGCMAEPEAYAFMRSVCPEWFTAEAA